ncbi:MAG: hypothetical protein IPO51_04545 [Dehalococcoidia bacterium]|nr:hypothetical protein [Dehalococcoidia bacterium]
MTSAEPVFHLALRDFHATAGATFGLHNGWSLPLSYVGVPENTGELPRARGGV